MVLVSAMRFMTGPSCAHAKPGKARTPMVNTTARARFICVAPGLRRGVPNDNLGHFEVTGTSTLFAILHQDTFSQPCMGRKARQCLQPAIFRPSDSKAC